MLQWTLYMNSLTEVYISSNKLQPFVFRFVVQRKKNNPVHSCALPLTVSAASTELLLQGKQNAKVAGRRNKKPPWLRETCGRDKQGWRSLTSSWGRQQKSEKTSNWALSLQRDGKKMKVVVGLPQSGEEGVSVCVGWAWCVYVWVRGGWGKGAQCEGRWNIHDGPVTYISSPCLTWQQGVSAARGDSWESTTPSPPTHRGRWNIPAAPWRHATARRRSSER